MLDIADVGGLVDQLAAELPQLMPGPELVRHILALRAGACLAISSQRRPADQEQPRRE